MVQIPGKYQLVENKNFYEFLLGVGLPEDKAKEGNVIKGSLTVSVDGNKITLVNDSPPRTTNLVVGEEVDEKMGDKIELKTATTLSDNVITVSSKTKEGKPTGTRKYVFSDNGVEVNITSIKEGKTYSATRIYKRV